MWSVLGRPTRCGRAPVRPPSPKSPPHNVFVAHVAPHYGSPREWTGRRPTRLVARRLSDPHDCPPTRCCRPDDVFAPDDVRAAAKVVITIDLRELRPCSSRSPSCRARSARELMAPPLERLRPVRAPPAWRGRTASGMHELQHRFPHVPRGGLGGPRRAVGLDDSATTPSRPDASGAANCSSGARSPQLRILVQLARFR